MAEFLHRHAEVQGQLQLSDRWVNMVEEGVDCAIRIGHLPDSGLVARRLGETRRIIVAAPGYLERHGTPHEPRDVTAHHIIRFSAFEGAEEWRLFRDGVEERASIAPRLVTNSADAALCAAEREGGLTMVLAYQARAAIAAGRLIRVLREFEPPILPIQIAWPAARLIPAKLRAFIGTALDRRLADHIRIALGVTPQQGRRIRLAAAAGEKARLADPRTDAGIVQAAIH
eukprot:gene5635-7007_t